MYVMPNKEQIQFLLDFKRKRLEVITKLIASDNFMSMQFSEEKAELEADIRDYERVLAS